MRKQVATLVAIGISVFTVVLFFLCMMAIDRFYQPRDLSKPAFVWAYETASVDRLPQEFEWVRDVAFEKHVDDEGAIVCLTNVCGDSRPEAVFHYQHDGIIFTNTTLLEVYSQDGMPLKTTDSSTRITYNTVNAINPRNGLIFHEIGFPFVNVAYYFAAGRYHKTWLYFPLHMICRYAISFGLFFFSPCNVEICLLFLILQWIGYIVFLLYIDKQRRLTDVLVFGFIRTFILVIIGVLYSIPAVIAPLLLIAGPFIGFVSFTIIALIPIERWVHIRV
jgi:hypothetical protein